MFVFEMFGNGCIVHISTWMEKYKITNVKEWISHIWFGDLCHKLYACFFFLMYRLYTNRPYSNQNQIELRVYILFKYSRL